MLKHLHISTHSWMHSPKDNEIRHTHSVRDGYTHTHTLCNVSNIKFNAIPYGSLSSEYTHTHTHTHTHTESMYHMSAVSAMLNPLHLLRVKFHTEMERSLRSCSIMR